MNMAFEGHVAIVGQTFTGKSAFAKHYYAQPYLEAGIKVLVLDPNFDDWPCTWKTDSFEDFYAAARINPGSLLIADEGAESLPWFDPRANWLANRSRHYGSRFVCLSQRPRGFSTDIRGQISVVHAFFLNQKRDAQATEDISGIPWQKIMALPFYHCYTWKARDGAKPPRIQKLDLSKC